LDPAPLVSGDFELFPAEAQAFLRGERLPLTKHEFEVLEVLVVGANRVLSRELIREHVWGRPLSHERDRSVDVVVRRLRLKLARAAPGREYIFTHFGLGYRFDPGAPQP
jgi:two-component system catabolic regulation response regulator CreB